MVNIVYCGDDKPIRFPVPDDLAVELGGASCLCSIRLKGSATTIAAAETSVDAANRVCWAWFSDAQTSAFTAGKTYEGDCLLVLADSDTHTIGTVTFTAKARITPNP